MYTYTIHVLELCKAWYLPVHCMYQFILSGIFQHICSLWYIKPNIAWKMLLCIFWFPACPGPVCSKYQRVKLDGDPKCLGERLSCEAQAWRRAVHVEECCFTKPTPWVSWWTHQVPACIMEPPASAPCACLGFLRTI